MEEHKFVKRVDQPTTEQDIKEQLERKLSPDSAKVEDQVQINQEPQAPAIPLTVDYFELNHDSWANFLLEPKLDAYQLKDKIIFIDSFLRGHIDSDGTLKNEPATYQNILSKIEQILGLDKMTKTHIRVSRVYEMLKVVKEQKEEFQKNVNIIKSIIDGKNKYLKVK